MGIAFVLFSALSADAQAAVTAVSAASASREWRKIEVPGAVCGDGQGYSIFVSPGNPRKIAFDVMGGGACWSASTCYALPDTWVHPLPKVLETGGFVSLDPACTWAATSRTTRPESLFTMRARSIFRPRSSDCWTDTRWISRTPSSS
jgi:hypothetical protein